MNTYKVALVQDKTDGMLYVAHWIEFSDAEHDSLFKDSMLESYGDHRCLFFVSTRDKGTYLTARIRCACAELRSLVQYHNQLMDESFECIEDKLYESCLEDQRVYFKRIGRLVNRLFTYVNDHDLEMPDLNDTIALSCYDWFVKDRESRWARQKAEKIVNG